MTLEEKLQHFYDLSVEEASREGQELLQEYQLALDRLFEEHKKAKKEAARLRIESERTALLREANKELAGRQIKMRHDLAEQQNEILEEIFEEVKQQLTAFQQDERYVEWICDRITLARKNAGREEMEIYIDPSDAHLKETIEKQTGETLLISERVFQGGVRVVVRSMRILMDDSFAALINEAKDKFSFEGGVHR